MKPPPRLIDDPESAPELRADLERIAASAVPYDARAGLLALESALGATSGPSASPNGALPNGAAGLASSAAKIGALSTGAVVLTAAVFAWVGLGPAAKPPAATDRRTASEARSTTPPPSAAQPAQPAQQAPAAEPSPTEPHGPSAATPIASERAPAPDAALQREVAQLGRIKLLLPGDPQQAYRLAQAGHREFRAGMLRHEREGLAILALWQLERRAEAGRRTRAFLTRYPESPLREQLAQRLAGAGASSAKEP
ncbi:MAG TPA: hypothetical protein VK509_17195 [Polyangiales bacterium]|nr:hypothetical protein [Polyangiales bacterium]